MEREDQTKYQQGANGMAMTTMLPAMSSFPSLVSILFSLQVSTYLSILHRIAPSRDENGTEIFQTDRFHFLYYDTIFYIMISFPNFAKHKILSFSIGFATIFNHFLYSLIAKMQKYPESTAFVFYIVIPFPTVFIPNCSKQAIPTQAKEAQATKHTLQVGREIYQIVIFKDIYTSRRKDSSNCYI